MKQTIQVSKEQEIIDGNKLIAEFMGAEIDNGYKDTLTYRYPLESAPKEYASYVWSADGLQYHSSWDWLMPVVEKIEGLGWEVMISKGLCHIFSDNFPKVQDEFANKSNNDVTAKITLTWKTVIEFIQWYNSNPQTK